MGYNRELLVTRGYVSTSGGDMKATLEETIKKIAVDVQENIKRKPTIDRDAAIAAKTNALANLARAFVELPNKSDGRIEELEKKVADLEMKIQSQQKELERYGINFR